MHIHHVVDKVQVAGAQGITSEHSLGQMACTHGVACAKALAITDGGLALCPLICRLQRIELQQRAVRRLWLGRDEPAEDGTRRVVNTQ